MANHPHHDDDQSKKTPDSGVMPKKPSVPNMSLDDDEPFVVDEVVEAEVIPLDEGEPEDALPIVEAAPESEIVAAEPFEEATVLASDVVAEEVAEAMPASDVMWGEEVTPAAHAETPEPGAHRKVEPASEVNLAELFGNAYAPPSSDVVAASAPTAELPVQPAGTPASSVQYDDRHPIIEDILPSPASDIHEAEEIVEVAEAEPASAIVEAEEMIEEAAEVVEAEAESAVVAAEEVVEEVEEAVEAEAESAVVAAEEVVEEAAEFVEAEEEVVAEAEEVEEAASAVEVAEEVGDAEPISAVVEAEEFEEIEEVSEASDVLAAEEVAEIAPPSEMNSGEMVEVLAEEVEDDEPVSAVAVEDDDDPFGVTEFADSPLPLNSSDSAVLAAEPAHAGSSAVLADEDVETVGKKKKAASNENDKTVAFGGPPSSIVEAEPDSLVTEEEVIEDAEPASAVNLAEASGRKSSATGIDKVAEALESGVGLDSNELANTSLPEPSVEFDEILDEADALPKSKRKGKQSVDDDVAEALDDEAAEIFDMDEEPVSSSKSKSKVKATGDDIDLDDVFSEAEAAEAIDADEAVAAEAEEEFAKAADDDEDDAPKKKKAVAKSGDDEEAVEAVAEDEDEDTSAKKKKKGKKDKATVAPQTQGSSAAMQWAGRFFMLFLGMFLVLGGLGAGLFFAAGSITPLLFALADDSVKKEAAESIHKTKVAAPPKVDGRTPLDKLRDSFAKGEYEEVTKELAAPADEAEFDLRGQAKWFAYAKQQAEKKQPISKAAPEIKEAKDDLAKGKNVALIAQIDLLLKGGGGDNTAEIAKLKTLEATARANSEKTQKVLDGVADVLVKADYLKDKKMFSVATLEKVIQSLNEDRTSLEALNKVLTDAKYKDGAEGIMAVLKEKKAADDSMVAINKVLENEKTKDKGDKGVLEIIEARKKAEAEITNVGKDRDDVLATIKRAYDELLAAKIVTDDKADPRMALVKAVQKARLKAEFSENPSLAKAYAELDGFRSREEYLQKPQEKLDTYITLFQDRSENNPKALDAIIKEAGWVLTPEAKSTPEQQAKARYVQGLALRNQEKFAEAKTAFAEALKKVPAGDKSAWSQLARQSHAELLDPNVYYLPRVERLQNEGNLKAALAELNSALKALPNDARLLALRGLVRYETVRGQGAKVPEVAQKAIREDAEFAGKNDALAAESQYIVGLLEEELGNVSEAEKLYRAAIKTRDERKSSIDDNGKYRVALANLLLRGRTPVIAVPPMEEKKVDEKDKVGATSTSEERVIVLHPWSPLVVSAVIAQAGGDDVVEDKDTVARLNETVKLANELIASTNPKLKGQGYLLLGSAYSKLGRRTDGLKEYSKGLQLIFPGMQTREMNKMIEEHPAFQQQDASTEPNPVMSERYFGEGMHFYYAKQYAEAEAQFRQAVKYYKNDARYHYYLGLAQYGQATRAKQSLAKVSFEEGARLEARTASTNPLAVRDINASLERIQGELRATLNSYRFKANAEPEEVKKGL